MVQALFIWQGWHILQFVLIFGILMMQQARMQMDRSKACQQVSCALSGIMSEPDGKSNFQQTPSRHFDAMWLTATEQLHVNTKYGSLDS